MLSPGRMGRWFGAIGALALPYAVVVAAASLSGGGAVERAAVVGVESAGETRPVRACPPYHLCDERGETIDPVEFPPIARRASRLDERFFREVSVDIVKANLRRAGMPRDEYLGFLRAGGVCAAVRDPVPPRVGLVLGEAREEFDRVYALGPEVPGPDEAAEEVGLILTEPDHDLSGGRIHVRRVSRRTWCEAGIARSRRGACA